MEKPVDYNELDDTYFYLRDKSEKFVIAKSTISTVPKCQNGALKCTFDNWRYGRDRANSAIIQQQLAEKINLSAQSKEWLWICNVAGFLQEKAIADTEAVKF